MVLWKRTVSADVRANHPKLYRNCALPQNLHTSKLGTILVFSAAKLNNIAYKLTFSLY